MNTSASSSTRLRVVVLYNRLRNNPNLKMTPRTFFFAGKAAPAYHLAKVIIKFLNNLAGTIDGDPMVRGHLKVVFLPEYCVSSCGALDSGDRCYLCFESDFNSRLRSQRHEQYEIYDEWSIDLGYTRRRYHRDGGGSRGGEFLPVRADRKSGVRQPQLV